MKILSQEEARDELDGYMNTIADAIERAVSEANTQAKPHNTKRTRAELVRDQAVQNLKEEFTNTSGVTVLEKDNTVLFRFGESIIARVKKLDKNFNASYNHTPSSRDYTSQNYELFGEEHKLTSVHIGYVLDGFGVSISNMAIVCPVNKGKRYTWIIPIDGSTTMTGSLSFPNGPTDADTNADDRFKVKTYSDDESEVNENQTQHEDKKKQTDGRLRIKSKLQKGESQNGRTSEGGA
ncbi:MAG: hypothetical protein ED557_05670 [Balneola sp.]|nr:MAG: hypothetical protein ED557_05670 [Balneola sp.]